MDRVSMDQSMDQTMDQFMYCPWIVHGYVGLLGWCQVFFWFSICSVFSWSSLIAADLQAFRFFSYNFTSRKAMSVREFLDSFINEFSFSSTVEVTLAVFSTVWSQRSLCDDTTWFWVSAWGSADEIPLTDGAASWWYSRLHFRKAILWEPQLCISVCQPYIRRMSAVYLPYVSRLSAVCLPYVRHISAVCQPWNGRMSEVCPPYVSHMSAVCQLYIRRMSAIPNLPICLEFLFWSG